MFVSLLFMADFVSRDEFEHFIAEFEDFRKDTEKKIRDIENTIDKLNEVLDQLKERKVLTGQTKL